MQIFQRIKNWFLNQKLVSKIVVITISLVVLCCMCSFPIALLSPKSETPVPVAAEVRQENAEAQAAAPTKTTAPTKTPVPTNTPKPTNTAKPTNTPLPPTETPDPNYISKGTYLVGTDIRPGFYRGSTKGFSIWDSCYWARLKDTSGELGSILANDNSVGQFYIEVLSSDYALETACDLTYLEKLPDPAAEFPTKIEPGMYLVGIDIRPGQYRGQAGEEILESCYWARLRNVKGSLDGILSNNNANGQYYVKVNPNDFALKTACELERVGD
jgi:hypothetical protein